MWVKERTPNAIMLSIIISIVGAIVYGLLGGGHSFWNVANTIFFISLFLLCAPVTKTKVYRNKTKNNDDEED